MHLTLIYLVDAMHENISNFTGKSVPRFLTCKYSHICPFVMMNCNVPVITWEDFVITRLLYWHFYILLYRVLTKTLSLFECFSPLGRIILPFRHVTTNIVCI